MSETKDTTVELATPEAPSLPATTAEPQSQGEQPPWNFNDNIEDKNPFSEFSEEHLNKLDEVLSSVEVRELLQQSTPELGILNMDLEGTAGNGSSETPADSQDTEDPPAGSEQDDAESLPESVISAVFSDHGYAINPERAPKSKPAAGTSVLPKSNQVLISMDTDHSAPIIGLNTDGTLIKGEEHPLLDVDMTKPASPYSPSSPRKSGRAPTRNRYLDDDWVTSSPYRGRGRGRGAVVADSGAFGLRASTRISDQKQRDLAEKIMMANRQAMEAEKQESSSSPESRGKGRGKKDLEEVPVPAGRGRGRGKKVKSGAKGKSSQEESEEEEEEEENEDEEESEDNKSDGEVETVDSEPEPETVKKKKKKKKGATYEHDSDFSEPETKKGKKKKVKRKGKKGKAVEEESETETSKKKGKTKGKVDSEGTVKVGKGKKKGGDDQTDGEKSGKTKKSENTENESEDNTKTKGKKGKKKLKLKNKKLKKKGKKEAESEEESESKDKDEKDSKSPKVKSPKKLSKKERLKKLKEAKAAKKAKLLEKKKEKLKATKLIKKKGKKAAETEPETSDVSPTKKKKKGVEKGAVESPTRKAKATEDAKTQSPTNKKVGKTVAKGVKKRSDDKQDLDTASPAKKAKVEKQTKVKAKREMSDSEDDVPLKKIKTEMEAEATKLEASKVETKKESQPKVTKEDQNIFSNLAGGMKQETSPIKPPLAKPAATTQSAKSDSTGTVSDSPTSKQVKTDTKDTSESAKVKNDKEAGTGVKDTVGKEVSKEQDSKDKHSHHHHHHHHHHRRHSSEHRESVSSDDRRHSRDRRESTSDSKKDSHRRDSHDKSDSHSRRDSKDRKESHHRRDSHEKSRDKDRRSSHSKDRKERRESSSSKDRRDSTRDNDKKADKSKERRDSATSSVSSTNGDKTGKNSNVTKKAVTKDSKIKPKKVKKEEIPIDSSMIDLFKPDNLPSPTKEEQEFKVKETMEETVIKASKVKFKDETVDKQSSEVKPIDVDKSVSEVKPNEMDKSLSEVKISEVEEDSAMKEGNENISVEVKKSVHKESVKDEQVESKSVDVSLESKEIVVNKVLSEAIPCADTTLGSGDNSQVVTEKKEDTTIVETKVTNSVPEVKKDSAKDETKQTEAVKDSAIDIVSTVSKEQKEIPVVEKQVKAPVKQKLKMSDFFTEKRLKINDPKPRYKVVKVVEPAEDDAGDTGQGTSAAAPEASGADGQRKRSSRNKAVAFAEILKKEKLGSDEEEEEDVEFEDDENDEDFEDPDKLYCICRQPHNQRFMICCDRCEEWFHGKCVDITRARGAQMEENNEEYICPQCSENDPASQGESSPTDTQDTSLKDAQSADSDSAKSSEGKERASLFESMAGVETQTQESAVDYKVASSSDKSPATSKSDKHQSHKTSEQATPSSKQATPSTKQATPSSSKTEDKMGEKKKKSPLGQIRKKSDTDLSEKRRRTIKMFKDGVSPSKDKKTAKCMHCNSRPPKSGSVYCSSECQAKYTKDIVKPVSILKVKYSKDQKHDKEKHVAVVEKSTGKTLTGDKAPTEKELKDWLARHPTYEILKAHKRPESKSDKKPDSKSSKQSSKTEGSDSKSQKHSEGPEPVRLNVRKGLRDALAARVDAADDIMLSNSEIKGLSLSIEEELYRYFKDTDHKYKAKYRSLIFNIKDHKNKGLFRKILNGRIRPSKLVRMSADELASKELAQWREQETKHTIEMIKQTETELMKEQTHVTKKTHKGEVEVEGEGGSDLSSLVTPEPKKEAPKPSEPKTDLLAELLPDTTDKHGQHLFDANCKICTGKLAPAVDTTPAKSTTVVKTETKEKEKPEESMTKQERELQAEEVVKEVLKVIQRAKADAKKEELESQLLSSVTVRSPDSALSSGLDKKVKFTPNGPMLWKGFIYMQDVSKFVTTAYRVTGPAENLSLPDTITVCGRINPEHVWDYLSKVKQAASRDISVIRFIPGPSEEKAAYINLYSYLNSRSRCGVVEHSVKYIKDFYIVPLASHSKIPDVLMPFDGPGLEENRCHMLLGVIIRNKVHKSSSLDLPKSSRSSSKSLKSALKDPMDSEKTSLASTPDKSSSSSSTPTPSSSGTPQEKKKAISFDPIVKEYSHVPDQEEPYEPGGDDPLGLNAPYDPEKESMKPAPKKASKSDAVSLMIEKIAMSKNPAEATAAMVTALATSSRIGNQRKLLEELTKKVDEQKRLLEKKKMTSKSGDSPRAGPSSNTASPGLQGSPKSSTRKRNNGVSSKDPRIRAAMAAKQASEEAARSPAPTTEPMDVDMRIPQPVVNTGASSQRPTPSDPRLRQTANTVPVPSPAAVSSASLVTSTTSVSQEISNSQKHSADSSVSGNKPKGFYIDHDTAHSVSAQQTKNVTSKAAVSKTNTVKEKHGTNNDSVKDKSESSKNSGGWTEVSVVAESKKPFSVIEMLKKEKSSGAGVTDSKSAVTASADVSNSKTETSELADQKSAKEGATVAGSKSDPGIDIVSQLQAEVSGKSVSKDKPSADSVSASAIVGQIQAEVKGQSEITQDTQKKAVPNVTSLLKDLASGNAPGGSGQAGVQLPSALMSLFSKLPEQGQEPAKTEQAPEPTAAETEPEPEAEPQDVDMRNPAQAGGMVPGIKVLEENKPNVAKKITETVEKEKLSKSFMGFDYDSDSSDGSFEGFDDDGTKKLSPRKRKLVEKGKASSSQKSEASQEDTDTRQEAEDVDLRTLPGNVAMGNEDLKDVDERLNQPPTAGHTPGTDMDIPTSMMMDVDHRRPPFPPPSGLGMPFLAPNQPPPPGEEWNTNTMPAPPPFPMSNLPPPPAISQSPPDVTQPPLPAEPPAPKPPEPPVKKSKSADHKKKDKDEKTEKKVDKNKLGPLTSDERLKEIVLKIAGKDSIDTPPRSSMGSSGSHRVPFSSPPLLPMPPQIMPQGPPPMVTQSGMPVLPPVLPPPISQNPPWSDHSGIGTSGWRDGPPPPRLLNSRSSMAPPVLPPQLQPGVVPPPPHPSVGPGPSPPHPSAGPPPPHPSAGPPSHSDSGPSMPPPSLLAMPPVLPVAKQDTQVHEDFDPYPPRLQPEFSGRTHHGHSPHGRRSHEHESDRRRHDRYGDRDSDRHRSRDHHRDRDRDGRDRSRGDRDRDRRYRR